MQGTTLNLSDSSVRADTKELASDRSSEKKSSEPEKNGTKGKDDDEDSEDPEDDGSTTSEKGPGRAKSKKPEDLEEADSDAEEFQKSTDELLQINCRMLSGAVFRVGLRKCDAKSRKITVEFEGDVDESTRTSITTSTSREGKSQCSNVKGPEGLQPEVT